MITVKITSGGKSTVQGSGKWSYAWINNAGETAIYATTEWGTQTVTERIAEYEAGGAKDIVKLPAGSSKRLRANNGPVIIFGAEAGMAEVDLTNTDVSPFKVQAKGGDDGKIESLSVTENGTYTASGEVKGYSPVSVSVQPNLGTKNISDNGTYTASTDQLDGYSSVTVAVQPNLGTKSVSDNGTYDAVDDDLDGYSSVTVAVSKDFYPKAHATLDDASRVEGDDMRVYPMGGTDYYPYVYLGAMPYPAQQGDDFEPCGKYFAGQTQEHTVTTFLDLIDVTTGESVSGYPQRVAPNWSVSIVDGGYMRIVSWTVKASGAVSVTTERYNPTYTKPLQDTKDSAAVTGGKLDAYVDASYYIDGGAGESVLLQSLTATANGTYTAPARTAYNEVTVNVPAPAIVTKHIRGNGIFSAADDNVDGYSSVIVDGSPDAAAFNIITLTDPAKLTVTFASPATENYTGDFLITWGDGSENTSITTTGNGSISHTYPSVGTYGVMLYPIDAAFKASTSTVAGYNAFFQNAVIEYAKISNTMASFIENEPWFYSEKNFKSVSVPDNVTKLANGMFAQHSVLTLKTVYMRSTTPPTFPQYSWADPFSGVNLEAIYVPASAVSAYKAASGWSTYANIIQPMPL